MEIRVYTLDNNEVFTDMAAALARAKEIHSHLYKRVIIIKDYVYNDCVWYTRENAEKYGCAKIQ